LKTIVIKTHENTRVPFLRGILTRSLLDAGLVFKDAFNLATTLRDELSDTAEISTSAIHEKVCQLLEEAGDPDVVEAYSQPVAGPARIQVYSLSDTVSSFSRGRHERYLQASGLKAEKAEHTTALIYDQLLVAGTSKISTCQLGFLTWLCLKQEVSNKAAKRYLVWSEYQRSARPLLLMICGTVGSGKSTIATEIAHLLDIVRIQSTDMLREVMRMMIPSRLLPVLHTSSFNAWQALPIQDADQRDKDQLVADGYRSQADLLAIPCEAVIQRAVEESVPMILEGVHAHPDLIARLPKDSDAIVAHVTLAVLKPKMLKSRLRGRGVDVPQRRAKRYLNKFESVWSLQTFLLSEADRCNVPIITNEDKEKAAQNVILQVIDVLSDHYSGSPGDIFGSVADSVLERGEPVSWRLVITMFGEK
jgi:2-phosphoglycerate kinase